jgi:hypothetical protein
VALKRTFEKRRFFNPFKRSPKVEPGRSIAEETMGVHIENDVSPGETNSYGAPAPHRRGN